MVPSELEFGFRVRPLAAGAVALLVFLLHGQHPELDEAASRQVDGMLCEAGVF